MTNPIRNTFIINHAFRRFFVASILISIISQFNILVDGVIVSQTVGPDAISAVNMSMPLLSLTMLIATMIYSGASLIMTGEIGNQNYKQVNRLFTISMSSIFIINIALAIVLYLCTSAISHLLTDDEQILSLLNAYLPISFIGCLPLVLQFALAQFIEISGRPGLVTKCMLIVSLGNIVLDLLLVIVLDMGMQGAALASATSALLSILVFVPYLRSEHKPFKFVSLKGGWYGTLLGRSLVRGVPVAVGMIMISVLIMGLNAIILKSQGPNGLFILSVCMQMLMISMLIMEGAGSTIIGIGGVLLGEQDYEGVHFLANKILKIINIGTVSISVVAIAFPTLLARLFGADEELLQIAKEPLRVFSFVFIPLGLIIPLSYLFMILKRTIMSTMLTVGIVVCMLPLMWLSSHFAPEYIWYSIPVSMWSLLIITMIATWIISRRNKGLHWFYLMQTSTHRHWTTYSVNYQRDDIERKLSELLDFVDRCNLSRKLFLNIQHCLEELMYNEIEMANLTKKKGTFDISVNNQDDKIYVIIKDIGKPYNPTIKYIPNHIEDVDESQLGMLVVHSLCKNINYKYMNGINCLYLNFEKNK